jgi:TRAP-type C4-dicarboxylate transport system permease small subunit
MLSELHQRLDRVLCRIEVLGLVVAGVALVAAMLLVSADALMRYLFSAPLAFQLHVSEFYLLPASLTMALAWGYRTGGTIQIQFLISSLPDWLVIVLTRVSLVAASAYMAYIAWRGYLVFLRAFRRNEVVMGVLDWPVSLSWVWIPLGCGLLALRLLLDAVAPDPRRLGLAHE